MKKFKERLKNQKGFTLIEMLIVVAIIAILVAVSIPVVSNSMDKTRHATDSANERAAKAEMMIQYLADDEAIIYTGTGNTLTANTEKLDKDTVYFYDANKGVIKKTDAPEAYGKCKAGSSDDHDDMYLALKIDENGQVFMQWTKDSAVNLADIINGNLCSTQSSVDHK